MSQNSILRRFFESKLYLALGVAVLLLLSFSFMRAYYQNRQIKLEIRRMESEVARLEGEKFNLDEMLKYVGTDAFVDEKARTELNLIKEGEKVMVINRIAGEPVGQSENKVVESSIVSNPRKWWNYFFKRN